MANVIRGAQGEKKTLSVRASRGTALGGMKPDFAPSDLAPNDFINLENIRRVGGQVLSRPGQVEFAPLEGEATGMVDFQTAGVMAGSGTDDSGGGGRTVLIRGQFDLYSYSQYQVPPIKTLYLETVSSDDHPIVIDVNMPAAGDIPGFRGLIVNQVIGTISGVWQPCQYRRIELPADPSGLDVASAGIPPWSHVFSPPPPPPDPPYPYGFGVTQVGNRVIFSVQGMGETGIMFGWDGRTAILEFVGGSRFGQLVTFRDKVVSWAFNGGMPVSFLVRAPTGVWTTVAAPVGVFYPQFRAHATASYRDRLYIPGSNNGALIRFDGTVFDELLPATTGVTTAAPFIHNVKTFGGYLYYLWSGRSAPGSGFAAQFWLGRFDGTTWDPTYKDLQGQFPQAVTYWGGSLGMCVAQGSLWVFLEINVSTNHELVHSPGLDVAGVWISVPGPNVDAGRAALLAI